MDSFLASRGIVYEADEPFLVRIGPLDGVGMSILWQEDSSRLRGDEAMVKLESNGLFAAWGLSDISYLNHSWENTGSISAIDASDHYPLGAPYWTNVS